MRCAGIDLASQDKNTACCVLDWSNVTATVQCLESNVSDDRIIEVASFVDKMGIDIPLGWPAKFVEALYPYSQGESWPHYDHHDSRSFRYRQTDTWLHDALDFPLPLSVSTDRIAIPTMRAVGLLSRLPFKVERDGSGVVTEVYPAAALRQWGLIARGYKRPANTDIRQRLIDELREACEPWLALSDEVVAKCVGDDNVLDALVAALVARAAFVGQTEEIPVEHREIARREGWIAVPRKNSLGQLISGDAPTCGMSN